MQNERNIFYGGEVRQEEYDLLQALREKDFELEQDEMRLMRLREERQAEGLQVE